MLEKLKLPLFTILSITTAIPAAWAQVDDLTVIQAVWTTRIGSDKQFVGKLSDGSPAKPLYFWTRLQGGPEALERLRQEGRLPIVHQWVHSTAVEQTVDEVDPDQEGTHLSVGSIRGTGGLASMVDASGAFRWRTWSLKQSVAPGTWTVTVRYATGEPVMCGSRACRWSIELN